MKLIRCSQIFSLEFYILCIPNKSIVVQEDDTTWKDSETGGIQGKETD